MTKKKNKPVEEELSSASSRKGDLGGGVSLDGSGLRGEGEGRSGEGSKPEGKVEASPAAGGASSEEGMRGGGQEADVSESVAYWRDQAEQWKQKYLYTLAELQNLQRNLARERQQLFQKGVQDVLRALMEVLDDVERALSASMATTDIEALRKGVQLVQKKLTQLLSSYGVEEIRAEGELFDPSYHEAFMQEVVRDPELAGRVTRVLRKGYRVGNTVLRHAQVVVGKYEEAKEVEKKESDTKEGVTEKGAFVSREEQSGEGASEEGDGAEHTSAN